MADLSCVFNHLESFYGQAHKIYGQAHGSECADNLHVIENKHVIGFSFEGGGSMYMEYIYNQYSTVHKQEHRETPFRRCEWYSPEKRDIPVCLAGNPDKSHVLHRK